MRAAMAVAVFRERYFAVEGLKEFYVERVEEGGYWFGPKAGGKVLLDQGEGR